MATLVVVAVGLAWRVARYALAFPLWGDEAFLAVNFLTRDFAGLTRPLDFRQVAPPGFLWAELAMARLLGTSEWSLRFLPFLAGIASLLLFWRLAQRLGTRREALLAVALFASSLLPVRHAAEVKPYSLDLLVSLLVTMLGLTLWREPSRISRWVLLTITAVVGVWVSYTAVFPVASVGSILIARGTRERSPRLVGLAMGFALVSAASWATMTFAFGRAQFAESGWLADYWSDGFPPLAKPWRLPLWFLQAHTGGLVAYPLGGPVYSGSITLAFLALGTRSWLLDPRRRHRVVFLLGPLPVAFLVACLGRYPYGAATRLTLYAAPGICMLTGVGLVRGLRWLGGLERGPVVVAGLFASIPLSGIGLDLAMPYRRSEDVAYRAFAQRLASQTRPGDRWIVHDGAEPLPAYPEVMRSVWVQRVAKLRFYLLSLSPVPARLETDPRRVEPRPTGRTWLVLHDHGFAPAYPRALRDVFPVVVATRLGPSRSARETLPVGSIVDVHAYDEPTRVANEASAERIRR